ncbi:ubiquinone biosynthesis protein UbiB, partial [bacterium]|nr:ubiquinone biosynthesis protein UbiB [bacterium]
MFNNFSAEPKAAASLSQVHLAELKTGEKVVVKVQRPDIKKVIFADLEILYALTKLADKYIEESRPYDPVGVMNEFKKSILREIDFTIEANNIDRFQRNFKDDNEVYIPSVVRDLSTEKVLTIAKVEGIKVTDIERIDKAGLDRKQIAINGANAVLKQIFINGYFHADLHPGNIFVLDGNKVAFIDFGMVGHIDEKTKAQLRSLLTAVVEQDVPEIIETFAELGVAEEVDFKKLNEDLTDFLGRYYGIPLKELKMERFLGDMMNIIAQNGIKIPPDLFLMAKTLITFEGIGRKLDCDFNMSVHTESFVEKLIKQGYSPKKVAKEIRKFSRRLYNFTYSLPKDLTFILNKIKKGTLRAEFEHRGLENLINVFDKVSNRISFSVVIAALIIGSSIIMQTDKGPILFGFPVLGV